MALVLAEVLDTAATQGTGASAQPTGILNMSGVSTYSLGTNGASIAYDDLANLMALISNANADGDAMAFLSNTKVRAALLKLKDSVARPYGLDVLLAGQPSAWSNTVPSNLTKGTGTGLSAGIYGNWSDLLIGVWSELDILVNPYESTAYARGGVSVRAMLTVDIAVRHPESFAVSKTRWPNHGIRKRLVRRAWHVAKLVVCGGRRRPDGIEWRLGAGLRGGRIQHGQRRDLERPPGYPLRYGQDR